MSKITYRPRIIDSVAQSQGLAGHKSFWSMENMSLSEKDKEQLKECLEGSVSFQDTIDELIKEYTEE